MDDHLGAAHRAGTDFYPAVDLFRSLAHDGQTKMRLVVLVHCLRIEPRSVVGDHYLNPVALIEKLQACLGEPGMFAHVGQRFLDDEQQLRLHVRCQRTAVPCVRQTELHGCSVTLVLPRQVLVQRDEK